MEKKVNQGDEINIQSTFVESTREQTAINTEIKDNFQTKIDVTVEQKKSCCNLNCVKNFIKNYWVLIGLILLVVLGTILLNITVVKNFIEITINKYGQKLTNLSNEYYWSFNFAFIGTHLFLTILLLPGEAITMVLSGFVTRKIVRAFILNFVGNLISACVIFPIVHYCFRDKC